MVVFKNLLTPELPTGLLEVLQCLEPVSVARGMGGSWPVGKARFYKVKRCVETDGNMPVRELWCNETQKRSVVAGLLNVLLSGRHSSLED